MACRKRRPWDGLTCGTEARPEIPLAESPGSRHDDSLDVAARNPVERHAVNEALRRGTSQITSRVLRGAIRPGHAGGQLGVRRAKQVTSEDRDPGDADRGDRQANQHEQGGDELDAQWGAAGQVLDGPPETGALR